MKTPCAIISHYAKMQTSEKDTIERELRALSLLDGQDAHRLADTEDTLSEEARIRARIQVEVTWLAALVGVIPPPQPEAAEFKRSIGKLYGKYETSIAPRKVTKSPMWPDAAVQVKTIEKTGKRSSEAVVQWVRDYAQTLPGATPELVDITHTMLTDADVDSLAGGIIFHAARAQFIEHATRLADTLEERGNLLLTETRTKIAALASRLMLHVGDLTKAEIAVVIGSQTRQQLAAMYPSVDWDKVVKEVVWILGKRPMSLTPRLPTVAAGVYAGSLIATGALENALGIVIESAVAAAPLGGSAAAEAALKSAVWNAQVARALSANISERLKIDLIYNQPSSAVYNGISAVFGHAMLALSFLESGIRPYNK